MTMVTANPEPRGTPDGLPFTKNSRKTFDPLPVHMIMLHTCHTVHNFGDHRGKVELERANWVIRDATMKRFPAID